MDLSTEYTSCSVTKPKDRKTWRAYIEFYTDSPDGEKHENRDHTVTTKRVRHRKSYTLEATGKKEAKAEADEILQRLRDELQKAREDAENGIVPEPELTPEQLAAAAQEAEMQAQRDKLVTEYVAEYIEQRTATLQRSTKADYLKTLKLIDEGLAGVTVGKLTRAKVKKWQAGLAGRGLSWSSTHKALRLLKAAMEEAVMDDVLAKNPCAKVTSGVKSSESKREGINALDFEGFGRTLQALTAMSPSPATVAPLIAMLAGLRRGEVCGLQWRDVELGDPDSGEGATLTVRRSIGQDGGKEYVKVPKNRKNRVIVISPLLALTLRKWRDACETEEQARGRRLHKARYVIGSGEGAEAVAGSYPWEPADRVSKKWANTSELLGIKGVADRLPTFHDLRHTYATIAIASGVDVKTVSHNLGHANAAITLNVYSAVLPDAQDKAAAAIQQAATRGIEAAKVLASEAIENGGDEW